MWLKAMYFASLFFAALALAPAMAHLLELPNKINLTGEDYLVVQRNYRGWALVGVAVVAAFVSTLVLTIMLRIRGGPFALALIAFLCIAGTQVIFWMYTFPANQQTSNWTVLPENWRALRAQWEYSHAASAVLNLAALTTLILAVVRRSQ
jgi:ABC-type branched-subunit amino acid transport system permease subunit